MNKMLSIGLSINMNICFNFIFIISDVNVRFIIVLLIREALVDDMCSGGSRQLLGVRSQQEVLFFLHSEFSGCTSQRVDFQSYLA